MKIIIDNPLKEKHKELPITSFAEGRRLVTNLSQNDKPKTGKIVDENGKIVKEI